MIDAALAVRAPAAEAQFSSHLAVDRKVSTSTRSQALQALSCLYLHVLNHDLPQLENVTRTQSSRPALRKWAFHR